MKKLLPLLLVCFISCTSEKEIMNSWVGRQKQELLLSWGPPTRSTSDGNSGEILVFSNQFSYNAQVYWRHKMFYVDQSGKIYFWRTQSNAVPPTQIILR